MTRRALSVVFVASALTIVSTPAQAQTLADALTFLVTNQSVPTGSIERDRDAAQAASVTIPGRSSPTSPRCPSRPRPARSRIV